MSGSWDTIPTQYSAETVCLNGDRMMLHVDGSMERFEMYPINRHPTIYIRRPDIGVEWKLSPHNKTSSHVMLPVGPEESEFMASIEPLLSEQWTEDGTEMIDGQTCLRLVGRNREAAQAADGGHTVCYVDTHTGLRRRECHFDLNANLVATVNYSPDIPPRSLFERPEGYAVQ